MTTKVTPMGPAPVLDYDGHVDLVPKIKRDRQTTQTGLFDFANTEAIKDKVRKAKLKPDAYSVTDFYYKTGRFQALATNAIFENFTLGVIVVNAIWISHDTDGNTAETILEARPRFVTLDSMFFGYFLFEVVVRFCAFARKRNCLRDNWFKFDLALVTLYAFDPFTIGIIAAATGIGLALPTAVLRLLRLARLFRLIRLLRNLPELMIMIKGMYTASASVAYTLMLLIIITYVFAIANVNLADPESEAGSTYFPTVPEAMHNLIVFGCFCDALADFILVVKKDSVPCFLLSWMYIGLANLTVLNMLVGVLCEVISAVAHEEKESMMVDKVKSKFGGIVEELDKNNDGTLSWDEFQKILDHPEALKALQSVNVDPESMIDMAEDYFFENGEPCDVTFEQFMNLLLDMRGGQNATLKDIMVQGKRTNSRFTMLQNRVDGIEKSASDISTMLDKVLSTRR